MTGIIRSKASKLIRSLSKVRMYLHPDFSFLLPRSCDKTPLLRINLYSENEKRREIYGDVKNGGACRVSCFGP